MIDNGKRIIPTIVFGDGSFLVEPSNPELARKLGLKTEAGLTYYDLVVIGGGPAGLTAAIYAGREGIDALVIERAALGGGGRLDRWGYILTGHALVHNGDRPPGYVVQDLAFLETSVPGIFAAGDVRASSTRQVASAAGEGPSAELLIREYLKRV